MVTVPLVASSCWARAKSTAAGIAKVNAPAAAHVRREFQAIE